MMNNFKQHASTLEILSKELQAKPESKIAFKGKLIVFTSFYDYVGHAAYTQSMVCLAMVLGKLGVNWDYWPVMGDFHVERAVDEAYTRFMRDPDATDILNIDSDESFTPESVLRLLEHPEEVVGGAYRMKNNWQAWTAIWNKDANGNPIGKILDAEKKEALLSAHHLPWGFLRVKKSALQKYIDAYPDMWVWNKDRTDKDYVFCEQGKRDHTRYSQDCEFSERLKAIGVQLWLDPNLTIDHWGRSKNTGNLHEHLRAMNETQAQATQVAATLKFDDKELAAFQQISQMAREIEERKAA